MTTRISINKHVIAKNLKHGTDDPPIAVRQGSKTTYAHDVRVGAGRFVYSKDKPLKCGARLWFETEEPVEVVA